MNKSGSSQQPAWDVMEGRWHTSFEWFLVDDGLIQYAFKTKDAADLFKQQGYMSYMLTTNLDNLTSETMLDAHDETNWAGSPTCVAPRKSALKE
jgi:hypothetical protein